MAYDADGVRGVVIDGATGHLLKIGSPGAAFADQVLAWMTDPDAYDVLSVGARRHFETSANWPSCVTRLIGEISAVVSEGNA